MKPITVMGMGLSRRDLTAFHWQVLSQADVLVGGRRHLRCFADLSAAQMPIQGDLSRLIHEIQGLMAADHAVVVLASGDPLFYGIGALLIKRLGKANVRVLANVSVPAAGFARLKLAWQDAAVVSLHGRFSHGQLMGALQQADTIAVLTDPTQDPAWLARFLLDREAEGFCFYVLEQLGMDGEQVAEYELADAAARSFSQPNIVVLERKPDSCSRVRPGPGMAEDCFSHQKGLITKAEVRAVALSKLQLNSPELCLWDLGAGSGSVAVEAACFLPRGRIIAVERSAERIADIRANKKRFGLLNLEIVQAHLPDGMEALPPPDRVFIGGGGKELPAILGRAVEYLRPGGVLAINTVVIESLQAARTCMGECGLEPETVQVQISRARDMPYGQRLQAENPVWILWGRKPAG